MLVSILVVKLGAHLDCVFGQLQLLDLTQPPEDLQRTLENYGCSEPSIHSESIDGQTKHKTETLMY